jgi:hypothetical protein
MPLVADARAGNVVTHGAASESPASTTERAPAQAADASAAAEAADASATAQAADASTTAEAAHVSAATEAAHVAAAEPAAHMSAATKAATVSAAPTVSAPATPAARECVGGQSSGESGSRRQNDHGLA